VKLREILITRIEELALQDVILTDWQTNDDQVVFKRGISGTTKSTLGITRRGIERISEAVNIVLEERPGVRGNYSEDVVTERIIDALQALALQGQNRDVGKAVNELLDGLRETSENWLIVTPVENLQIDLEFTIAGASFYRKRDQGIEALFQQARSMAGDRVEHDWFDLIRRGENECLATAIVAAAEPEKAMEKGLVAIERALNLLRLMQPYAGFGVTGSYHEGDREVTCVGLERTSFQQSYRPPVSVWPGIIRAQELNLLKTDERFQRIEALVMKPITSEMEARLLRALAWYGKAVQQADLRDKIVNAMIGIETILLLPYEGGKTEALSERAAFILGSDLTRRTEIAKTVRAVGRVRNDVVHKGQLEIRMKDVESAIHVLQKLILTIAVSVHETASINDFKARIDVMKFT
jgi:hypothetical protein